MHGLPVVDVGAVSARRRHDILSISVLTTGLVAMVVANTEERATHVPANALRTAAETSCRARS